MSVSLNSMVRRLLSKPLSLFNVPFLSRTPRHAIAASSTIGSYGATDSNAGNCLSDILNDNGIYLAVPKKKVSHQKKRQKLYGPGRKQLKMIHHLNRCPSCGHFKRANTICMHCFHEIRRIWKDHTVEQRAEPIQEQELSENDKRILYPGKKETEYTKKLKEKETYLDRRHRTLLVEREVSETKK
ncbi:LAMI_0A06018g1_1 [Lachancea mirantina]|uniref:Large ribosomal subunit protein bL32m n=1 Tax=Lachancea mirantina TaxID=1230905 RepID=A0A1G4IQ19_9SACH|nr:LAMI_0A06018g1_1 [Lachancea mirantina]